MWEVYVIYTGVLNMPSYLHSYYNTTAAFTVKFSYLSCMHFWRNYLQNVWGALGMEWLVEGRLCD